MSNRKSLYVILLFLSILCLILAGIIFHSRKQELTVSFLDVGQGDAILIQEGSKQILIDGGPNGQVLLEKLGKYVPFWDRNIEVIIATHPDQDHIDGLIDAMNAYGVSEVIDNSAESDSQVYKKYLETIGEKNIPRIKGQAGMNIKISDEVDLEILYPGEILENNPKDTNADSIVAKLTYGENSFLLTGDLTTKGEQDLIKSLGNLGTKSPIGDLVPKLHSQFLKVGHHGSKYSTSEEFLEKVAPRDAVISVGKNNRYGHPADEVINRLNGNKINVLRTDKIGDILYSCDSTNKCSLNSPNF